MPAWHEMHSRQRLLLPPTAPSQPAKIADHSQREWPVVVAIHFDVTPEIPDELAEITTYFAVKVSYQRSKHLRNRVFVQSKGGGLRC